MAGFDRDVVLEALRECVTVVRPGEVLAVRTPWDLDPADIDYLEEGTQRARTELGVKIVFLPGEEFALLNARKDGTGGLLRS